MGWEVRGGRMYLYRNRRVNGRPVKEYLAADDHLGFGQVMAHELEQLRRREAKSRRLVREERAAFRARVDGLLGAVALANTDLRVLAEGVLYTLGFHRHKRGEWRMRRELANLKNAIAALDQPGQKAQPMILYQPPADDTEAVALFAEARTGDADAKARVAELIRQRKWADWLGDLGRQATRQLIAKAAGGDPVWEAGIAQKARL
ncbi:MAG: hypothetical protein K2V38_23150 [Gemmataceae bacterium]|nr:hypothetical protein [Gemmataceae bacterium]